MSRRWREAFELVNILFVFLVPFLGWNPVLLLWIAQMSIGYKTHKAHKMRFIYASLAIIFTILVVFNCITRFLGTKIRM
jgi:hypothetical protein